MALRSAADEPHDADRDVPREGRDRDRAVVREGAEAREAAEARERAERRRDEERDRAERAERDRAHRRRQGLDEVVESVFRRFPDVNAKEVLDFIWEVSAEQMQQIKHLAQREAEQAVNELSELVEQNLDLLEMKREKPELFHKMLKRRELERQADSLARACRRAGGPEKEALKGQLGKVLQESFAVRLDLMKAEFATLAGELQRLEALIEKRQAHRDEIVQRRLQQLLEEEDFLDW